jgi:hypothetical protein
MKLICHGSRGTDGIRGALHQAAKDEGFEFVGLGRISSDAPTSRGGRKSAAARSKPRGSPDILTSK